MKRVEELAETLSMTELIRLQDVLSRAVVRRFEKRLALVFSDIVGSTPYFARFGDEAGRKLQQRHYDFVSAVIVPEGGRVVDTAGDGVFLCFERVEAAARAMVTLQRSIGADNALRSADHQLKVRIGVNVGPVLTDGTLVAGDAVNFCSRIAGAAGAGELWLSAAAHAELSDPQLRMRVRRQPAVNLKGVERPQDVFVLDWLDASRFPSHVVFEDGTRVALPARDVIRFGRLREEQGGTQANDIVVEPADPALRACISRWHFELHRRVDGFVLRSVSSSSSTAVDGHELGRGDEVPIQPGSRARLGGVMTLEFASDESLDEMTRLRR